METFIMLGVVSLVALYYVVIQPLLLTPPSDYATRDKFQESVDEDASEMSVILKMMADLKLDHAAGKITDEDFSQSMGELKKTLADAKRASQNLEEN